MKYVYVTKNTQSDTETMNGYSGTTLIHTNPEFLIWLWVDPVQTDLQAVQGINSSVNVISSASIQIV